jgi:L-glyceraldehyde 3-phosphate reductase
VDDYNNARNMLLEAFDMGITHFDLANNYGPPPGAAEETFGKIITSDLKEYRDELIISTKAGYYMWPGPYGEWGSRKYLLASLDQSLKRMKLEYVDIFYSHRPDPDTPKEETALALDQAVKQGKALYIGISNYQPEDTQIMCNIFDELKTPFIIHQPRYSMFDRQIEDGLLEVLNNNGKGCIVYSPLAQGILSEKYLKGIPLNSRAGKKHGFLQPAQVTSEKVEKVIELKKIADSRGQTISQMVVSWILRFKEITSVLVGTSNLLQLKENIESLQKKEFNLDELQEIEKILE